MSFIAVHLSGKVRYVFLGDRMSRPEMKGIACDPVRRADGKCIVSIARASALVVDGEGRQHVVPRRRLRLADSMRSTSG